MLKRSGGEGEKIRLQTRAEKTNLMNGHVVRMQLETPCNKMYRRFILVTAMGLTGRSFGKTLVFFEIYKRLIVVYKIVLKPSKKIAYAKAECTQDYRE